MLKVCKICVAVKNMYNFQRLQDIILLNDFSVPDGFSTRIIFSILVIVLLVVFRFILVKIMSLTTKNIKTRYVIRKIMSFLTAILMLFIVGKILFPGFDSFITFFGLLSAGIAIALKDLFANFTGWFFILFRQPFKVGDRIEVDGHAGDIIDIKPFVWTMIEIRNWVEADQSTGRIINIPNSYVFTKTIANYSKGFNYIWNEIPVILTYDSNWKLAKQIFLNIINEIAMPYVEKAKTEIENATEELLIYYNKLTPYVYVNKKDNGIILTIRYLSPPRRRRIIENDVWEKIFSEVAKNNDITFAYPSTRIYYEGSNDERFSNSK